MLIVNHLIIAPRAYKRKTPLHTENINEAVPKSR